MQLTVQNWQQHTNQAPQITTRTGKASNGRQNGELRRNNLAQKAGACMYDGSNQLLALQSEIHVLFRFQIKDEKC